MPNSHDSAFASLPELAAITAVFVGAGVVALGLMLLPESALGAAHVGAIGLSLALAGVFASDWVGRRTDLAPGTRRRLAIGFAALSLVLLVAFVVLNAATFSEGEEISS